MLKLFQHHHIAINTLYGFKINLSKKDGDEVQAKLASIVKGANVTYRELGKIEALYLHKDQIALCVKQAKKTNSLEKPYNVFIADFDVDPQLTAQLIDTKNKKYNPEVLKTIVNQMANNDKLRVGFSIDKNILPHLADQKSFKKDADECRQFYLDRSSASTNCTNLKMS